MIACANPGEFFALFRWAHLLLVGTKTDDWDVGTWIQLSNTCDVVTNFFMHWFTHLTLRRKLGEIFTANSPIFGMRLLGRTVHLDFDTMTRYDVARCEHLGLNKTVRLRGQSRRKGGASSAKDAGLSIDDIRSLGRWSLGVLDAYIKPKNTWRYEAHQKIAKNVLKNRVEKILPAELIF